jgi:hypothetical protein
MLETCFALLDIQQVLLEGAADTQLGPLSVIIVYALDLFLH